MYIYLGYILHETSTEETRSVCVCVCVTPIVSRPSFSGECFSPHIHQAQLGIPEGGWVGVITGM